MELKRKLSSGFNGVLASFILGFGISFAVEKPIEKKYSTVKPKDDYKIIEISTRDINRIHCPEGITFYQTSSEKYLAVTFDPQDKRKTDMFVKIKPIMISSDTTLTPKVIYDKSSKDLSVRCGSTLYTFILQPKNIPSRTIYISEDVQNNKPVLKSKLKDVSSNRVKQFETADKNSEDVFSKIIERNGDKKEALDFEKKADSYEAFLISLTFSVLKNNDIPGYKVIKFKVPVDEFKEGNLILNRVFESDSYRVYLYTFIANKDIQKPLREIDFAYLSKKPLAISIENLVMRKGYSTRILIIESINTPFSEVAYQKIKETFKASNKKTLFKR